MGFGFKHCVRQIFARHGLSGFMDCILSVNRESEDRKELFAECPHAALFESGC